jgi:glycosyltransferase involved in cell wall biosynthesis
MKKLSVVIPAYNEEQRIGNTLENYLDFYKRLKEEKKIKDFEIIVVLNGCRDNTLGVVKKYKCKELIILNFKRAGKGFAITEGFKDALKRDSDLIGFVDADMATLPEAFHDLFLNIYDDDGIIANRWHKDSIIIPKRSFVRQLFSSGFNLGVRTLFLFPHRDTQCGAKLFKKELIQKINPKLGSSEWSFDVDLLFYARREKAKIKSIPTTWIDKKGSHINKLRTPVTMALSAVRLRLVHSPFKFVVRIYRKLPDKWKFH